MVTLTSREHPYQMPFHYNVAIIARGGYCFNSHFTQEEPATVRSKKAKLIQSRARFPALPFVL